MAKILIVEDDTAISDIENLELKHEGFETIIAGDGEEAISLFEKESPDLIILDLMLPKISGLEVIRHIRRKSSVPVIMVTAKVKPTTKSSDLTLEQTTTLQSLLKSTSFLRESAPY